MRLSVWHRYCNKLGNSQSQRRLCPGKGENKMRFSLLSGMCLWISPAISRVMVKKTSAMNGFKKMAKNNSI